MSDFMTRLFKSIDNDFINYLNLKDKEITEETKTRYIDDLQFYKNRCIVPKHIIIEEYKDLFNSYALKDYHNNRKTSTARFAITNLLEFYFKIGRVSPKDYLDIRNELKKYQSKKTDVSDFLTKDDLTFILSSKFRYSTRRTEEERFLAPLILQLIYYTLFEQNHISQIKWRDIDLVNRKIRNIRSDEDNYCIKWIPLNEDVISLIESYKQFLIKKHNEIVQDDYFIYISQSPANNKSLNRIINLLNDTKDNYEKLSGRVNVQKMIRSRILHGLLDTDGRQLIDFYEIVGLSKETQIVTAIKEYFTIINSKKAYGI
ncbi:hypothetical protein M3650_26275 [Paenibacillus sp. MER TA 81-3]|uniref:hypothetical protein n=1 Tax=Paenibacillus sp. MER TA 81-3 TaxID=2939573 RepID=UPI00203BD9BB|nr:hypothetical protein [Paenibacillus sp. MER TA 81-3]MCM3342035.1 hypothetical protein [Paenibacillus sp. MER TA 81-3]